MNTRTKLEIAGGLVIFILLCLFGYEQYRKAVDVKVAEVIAQHDREADAKLDARLKQIADADAQRQKDYENKTAALTKLTPQQIVVKVPEYVPLAKEPVTIVKPTDAAATSGEAKPGDAIVPQADIKPIAQAILDGQKCSADLASCSTREKAWEDKYQLKSDESANWEKAAKGGSVWKRVRNTALKIAIGVGIGYALHR